MPFWPQEELIRLEELVKDKKPGEPITIETRMKNREGKSLRVLLSEVFVREEVSSKIGWIGYLTDVTELRQREEALKETNEFNQVLIDNLLAIVWMCDEEGRCCLVNKESARLLGWERGEFLGKLAPESPDICKSGLPYMKEGTLEALGEIWRKVIEKKELGMGDVPLLTKDSKIVIHRGVEIPYGKGEARLWMSTDITDLRKREAELRAIHDTSLKVSSSLELQQVLNLIVEGAVNLLDAEKAAILMLKDEEIGYRATYGFSPTSSRIKFKLGEGYIGQVALSGEPVIVSDAPSDP
jgi:PAS domain-containing protein